ncbi:hypothetical protein BC833DRAFT_562156 [Globomyces pollinis-pini]|nr:hypothetical protein BC833DRAFT_562156 [Globomyces pollinis-pini]
MLMVVNVVVVIKVIKHIGIQQCLIRDHVKNTMDIKLVKEGTKDMMADFFTKALQFPKHRLSLGFIITIRQALLFETQYELTVTPRTSTIHGKYNTDEVTQPVHLAQVHVRPITHTFQIRTFTRFHPGGRRSNISGHQKFLTGQLGWSNIDLWKYKVIILSRSLIQLLATYNLICFSVAFHASALTRQTYLQIILVRRTS